MKSIVIYIAFLLFISPVTYAQFEPDSINYPYDEWRREVLKKANVGNYSLFHTEEERLIIYYLNLARLDGPTFAKTYVQQYLDEMGIKPSSYTRSLLKDLSKVRNLDPLVPKRDLYTIAKNHAERMGKIGKTGHAGFKNRYKNTYKDYRQIGENCDYRRDHALDIVIRLLIDEGIADKAHRKNILMNEFDSVGVAIRKHKKYGFNAVMSFGDLEQ